MLRIACFGPALPFDFRWLAGAFRANSARKSRGRAEGKRIAAMQDLRGSSLPSRDCAPAHPCGAQIIHATTAPPAMSHVLFTL